MQIRATIIKMLNQHTPEDIARFIAWELVQQANHYKTAGAPLRAEYLASEANVFSEAAGRLHDMPYPTTVPVPKS